jgi:hypothetical protein
MINMDISCFDLLAFYAVTFGLMNKVPVLYNRVNVLDRMLECSYCTGFHAGWICYLFKCIMISANFSIAYALYFAFISATSSYIIDLYTDHIAE